MTPKFAIQKDTTGKITVWDYVLYGKDGGVAQWLQIKNDLTGNWQWAKTDMWDPNLTTVKGESKFSLPDKLSSSVKVIENASGTSTITLESTNYYDVVFIGKNEILVEFDKDGNPKRWLDTTTNKMEWLQGVDKVVYITPEGGTMSLTDAQKLAGLDAVTVRFKDFDQEALYAADLFSGVGIQVGGPPGYRVSLDVVYFSGEPFTGADGNTKFGIYFKKTDGSSGYIYFDENGAEKVIVNVHR